MTREEEPTRVASGATAEYGIDSPGTVLAFVVLAVLSLFFTAFAAGGNLVPLVVFFLLAFVANGATVVLLVISSKSGKRRAWQHTLDELALQGTEKTLDLGCGRGLVLIETARRLSTGRAHGIDIWRSKDQSGNARAVTEANAVAEGVADRVEIHDGDLRHLPFGDATFELVTASLALHHIEGADGRRDAVREIVRVLEPGGRVVIIDTAHLKEYQGVLEHAGMADSVVTGPTPSIFPPAKKLIARKP